MDFRTKVELPLGQVSIGHADPMMLWGSCFAENIGKRLTDNKFSCDVNPFGVAGLIAAYNESGDWLDQLKVYIYDNYIYLKDFFAQKLPEFPILPLEGTYLVWVDCSVLGIGSQKIEDSLLYGQKLWINAGIHYGEDGDRFIRVNIACPRKTLEEGLSRLEAGLKDLLVQASAL